MKQRTDNLCNRLKSFDLNNAITTNDLGKQEKIEDQKII